MLAARFDDEIVVLDAKAARLVWLDPAAARVLDACGGTSAAAIAAAAGEPAGRVTEMLDSLRDAGLVRRDAVGWARADIEWI